MPCSTYFNYVLKKLLKKLLKTVLRLLAMHGGVASIDSSDYKAPTNIFIHAPAKITLDYSAF